jgi:hypothetical protein
MDDKDYLQLLREAIAAGRINPSLDLGKLEHVDSPISVQADSNRWIYSLIIIVSAAAWFGGLWWAGAAAAAGAATWFSVGKRWHRRRMERRFYDLSLQQTEDWKKLWRMPGVTLADPASGAECISPEGNWRAFVGAVASRQAAESPSNLHLAPIRYSPSRTAPPRHSTASTHTTCPTVLQHGPPR